MKWPLFRLCIIVFVAAITLTACGQEQSASPQLGYKEIKSMVVDILKTDEGKKAVEEALGGGSGSSGSTGSMGMRMMTAQSGEEIRMAVKDTLVSDEYKKEIEKIMTDPKFAGDFAKAINSQSKQLHMQLIKDPTYQKAIQDMLKSPDVMKSFLELTNTPDYRKQSMTVMQEAMQNPLFRMEVLELLKSVVKDELQPKVEKKKPQEDQKQEQGGGEGEGGGEGGQGEEGGSGS
ncbi:spore germination lipoprotein GerD [Paenibacillus lactis]|uniref:spore germination lipoprotein GerD n=1 Tax=Paenibacillus lactis TaxID=228574 RepID=UPI0011A1B636